MSTFLDVLGNTALLDADFTLPCQDPTTMDLWFAEHTGDLLRAKELCSACPLRAACLAGAIERAEPCGVWGGEIFVDGAIVATKRGRGRPRKHALKAS